MFNECYIRFAALDYDIKNKSRLAHLTNNCIVSEFKNSPQKSKKSEKKNREPSPKFDGEDEPDEMDEDPENIWSLDDFKDWLNKNLGEKFNLGKPK